MAEFETLVVRKDDGVMWVSLNRPEVRNAINQQMQRELAQLWTGLRYDDDVRCVVLTGEGESFCTGIDRAEAVSDDNNAAMATGTYPGYPTPWMYDDPGRDVGPKTARPLETGRGRGPWHRVRRRVLHARRGRVHHCQ